MLHNVTPLDIFEPINQNFVWNCIKKKKIIMTLIEWSKYNSHLCSKTILYLIQQDQAVGFLRFRPLQEHWTLQTFPGHRTRNIICSVYKKMKKPEDLSLTFLNTVLRLRFHVDVLLLPAALVREKINAAALQCQTSLLQACTSMR